MKFMPYADDTIWLLFGLGIAMVGGSLVVYLVFSETGWAALGFILTGILVSVSFYLVGTHPPRGVRVELNEA